MCENQGVHRSAQHDNNDSANMWEQSTLWFCDAVSQWLNTDNETNKMAWWKEHVSNEEIYVHTTNYILCTCPWVFSCICSCEGNSWHKHPKGSKARNQARVTRLQIWGGWEHIWLERRITAGQWGYAAFTGRVYWGSCFLLLPCLQTKRAHICENIIPWTKGNAKLIPCLSHYICGKSPAEHTGKKKNRQHFHWRIPWTEPGVLYFCPQSWPVRTVKFKCLQAN